MNLSWDSLKDDLEYLIIRDFTLDCLAYFTLVIGISDCCTDFLDLWLNRGDLAVDLVIEIIELGQLLDVLLLELFFWITACEYSH